MSIVSAFRKLPQGWFRFHFLSKRLPTQLFFIFLKSASNVRGANEPFYAITRSVRKIAFLCWRYLHIEIRISLDSELKTFAILSVIILNNLAVIAKTRSSKIAQFSTMIYTSFNLESLFGS